MAGNNACHGSGPTGQSDSAAALPDTHPQMSTVKDLYKFAVDAIRKAGGMLEQDANLLQWHLLTVGHQIHGVGAALVISVLNLVVSIQNLDGNPSGWDHAARTVYEAGERPPVQMVLADLTALDGLEPLRTEVQEKSLPIAPEMYAARQSAVLPDGEQAFLQTAYYRMLIAGLAQTLTAELTENRAGFLDSRPELPLDPIEAPALDGFWWAEEADGIGSPEQFAVLRQGKQVLTLWYTGSADLRTETAYLTSLLEK